jgi:thiol-disulfide isomerase/thioredoxin
MRPILLAALLPLIACAERGAPEGPPDVSAVAYEADPRPYDPALDPGPAIDAALARARAENKLVLISMGGNWCPDCRILSGMMRANGLRELVEAEYEVVKVDVGDPLPGGGYTRNAQVAERFGAAGFEGVPTLLIVRPDGTVLNQDDRSIFRNARDRNPQDLADYLHRYAAG